MKYEFQLWLCFFLKNVPGRIGCYLRRLFFPCKMGGNSLIWDGCHIDSPSKLSIGSNVSINRNATINAGGGVEICDDVLIGPNVVIYSQNHNFKDVNLLIRKQGYNHSKVTVSNNVWIASNVIILPGVTIGAGCVVAAGSVVTKSFAENQIIAGVPARVIGGR